MEHPFSRTELLLGHDAMERLHHARVAVFGLGGVGGMAAEALCRSGVGALDLIDKDTVSLTNLNRQIFATRDAVGRPKVEAARDRLLSINPDLKLTLWQCFYLPETAAQFDFTQYDYIIDAIDTVTGKLQLALEARRCGTRIISSMGTGNKLDPTAFRVADITETRYCPLSRVMRKELRRRGIEHLKVVYSEEIAMTPAESDEQPEQGRRSIPGSTAFVPTAVGLILAGEVVKDIAGVNR